MTADAERIFLTPFELFYWPSIPGRGEFVRLVLEEAGAEYVDVARLPDDEGGGVAAIDAILFGDKGQIPGYAVPMLRAGDLVISQTANICAFLAGRCDLIPDDEALGLHANQLQLTLGDLVVEVHDTHHPISVGEYYEEQREEAQRRAAFFLESRLGKFLRYFEAALGVHQGEYFFGDTVSYVDLSAFHVLRGLEYAFPRRMERISDSIPALQSLAEGIEERPRISAYLDSERCLPFNEQGIFRHYPELDA